LLKLDTRHVRALGWLGVEEVDPGARDVVLSNHFIQFEIVPHVRGPIAELFLDTELLIANAAIEEEINVPVLAVEEFWGLIVADGGPSGEVTVENVGDQPAETVAVLTRQTRDTSAFWVVWGQEEERGGALLVIEETGGIDLRDLLAPVMSLLPSQNRVLSVHLMGHLFLIDVSHRHLRH
jgi:hypothetical protein